MSKSELRNAAMKGDAVPEFGWAELTPEQVERWRLVCLSHWISELDHAENTRQANALIDMALGYRRRGELLREAQEFIELSNQGIAVINLTLADRINAETEGGRVEPVR